MMLHGGGVAHQHADGLARSGFGQRENVRRDSRIRDELMVRVESGGERSKELPTTR
jgi:hypothetical protein